jgi:hypothetical protein
MKVLVRAIVYSVITGSLIYTMHRIAKLIDPYGQTSELEVITGMIIAAGILSPLMAGRLETIFSLSLQSFKKTRIALLTLLVVQLAIAIVGFWLYQNDRKNYYVNSEFAEAQKQYLSVDVQRKQKEIMKVQSQELIEKKLLVYLMDNLNKFDRSSDEKLLVGDSLCYIINEQMWAPEGERHRMIGVYSRRTLNVIASIRVASTHPYYEGVNVKIGDITRRLDLIQKDLDETLEQQKSFTLPLTRFIYYFITKQLNAISTIALILEGLTWIVWALIGPLAIAMFLSIFNFSKKM